MYIQIQKSKTIKKLLEDKRDVLLRRLDEIINEARIVNPKIE